MANVERDLPWNQTPKSMLAEISCSHEALIESLSEARWSSRAAPSWHR